MSEPKDPQEYNNPQLIKICKWDEDGMKCQNDAEHKGYCVEHIKKIDPDYGLSAATGAGVAGLISSNPAGWIIGAAVGLAVAAYLVSKSK